MKRISFFLTSLLIKNPYFVKNTNICLLWRLTVDNLLLQAEDLTPGQFFRKWRGLKLFFEANGSLIAKAILDLMKRREKELLSSDLFAAAIYMDDFNSHLLGEQLNPPELTETLDRVKARVLQLAFQLQENNLQDATD